MGCGCKINEPAIVGTFVDHSECKYAELQNEYIEAIFELALYNTAEIRRRLAESEFVPAELREMRLK